MTSLSRNARIAGVLYLTLMTAPLRLIYIPDNLIVGLEGAAVSPIIRSRFTFQVRLPSAANY